MLEKDDEEYNYTFFPQRLPNQGLTRLQKNSEFW